VVRLSTNVSKTRDFFNKFNKEILLWK